MTATLGWKLRRLRTMRPMEVGWRVRQLVAVQAERHGLRRPATTVTTGDHRVRGWTSGPIATGFDHALYTQAAERVLRGEWDVFALRGVQLGFPPRWNHDPKTGIAAPMTFGKSIDYRDERVVGSIKHLWELSRHLEVVTLAQAWHLTRDARYADGVRTLVESWIEQCPVGMGPHWTSSLELAIRLVNWACAWTLLADSPVLGEPFATRWLQSIHDHADFIVAYLSQYSSANNHLLGELMGLFVSAVAWPVFPESERWREHARRMLEAEAIAQVAPDGVLREQAFWYHHEVADMLLTCMLFGRANGHPLSDALARRVAAMIDLIASVMDVDGHVPMIGDADDAVIVRWSREPASSVYSSLLATGTVLFSRPDFKAAARRFDDKSRWLLGDAAAATFDALPTVPPQPHRQFADGGYYILGDGFGTADEVKAVVDAGPFGYLSIAAHAHADALALTLSVGGTEVLIDPGTYALHGQQHWRGYFRGTAAHNTVRVDHTDQGVIGGPFMWLAHADARCDAWTSTSERDVLVGAHDGYRRLEDPVEHTRRAEYDKRTKQLTIEDTLGCVSTHVVEIHWHLAESCRARVFGRTVEIEAGDRRLRIDCPVGLDAPVLVRGQEQPTLGWISRGLDSRQPTLTIACRGRITGTTTLTTTIQI